MPPVMTALFAFIASLYRSSTSLRLENLALRHQLAVVDVHRLPLLPEGARLCQAFHLNPLGAIASGSLLAAVPVEQAARAIAACTQAGIPCAQIATVVADPDTILLYTETTMQPLPTFPQDEIVKVFQPRA